MPVYKEWVVLDALNYIKDKIDGSLTYRWSCRMGICGSCGMMVNGEPKLSCATFLSSYAHNGNKIRVEPLRYFPVIRDLVTELSDFLAKLKGVKPWLIRQEEPPLSEGEFLQTPEQLENYKQFSMCINCTLCYAACPVVGLDPGFVGPAAIALAQRYNKDSRDQGADDRLAVLRAPGRNLGLHLRRRMHPGLPQARRPRRRHSGVQAESCCPLAQVFCPADGTHQQGCSP